MTSVIISTVLGLYAAVGVMYCVEKRRLDAARREVHVHEEKCDKEWVVLAKAVFWPITMWLEFEED